jgi:hypothetical protein
MVDEEYAPAARRLEPQQSLLRPVVAHTLLDRECCDVDDVDDQLTVSQYAKVVRVPGEVERTPSRILTGP